MTLETINSLLVLYGLIVTVAAILMYVKQWQMASDIRAIRNHFIKTKEINTNSSSSATAKVIDYDHRLDTVHPGDKVKRTYDGQTMLVESIEPEGICCYAGVIDGKQTYPKSALTYIE